MLLDLVKAFETVPHHKLVAAAVSKGYSLVLLRLSLAAYRLSRSIGIDGVYSVCIQATRGITAGSGFATSELKLLLLDIILELQRRWAPMLNTKLFVDDLTLATLGRPSALVKFMDEVVDFVVRAFQVDFLMEVSAKKSVALAGRPKLAVFLVRRHKQSKLSVTRRTKLLGTEACGGRRLSTKIFRDRFHKFTKTIHRYHALRRNGVCTKQMVRAAGTLAITYGCEVMGSSDSALLTARVAVAKAGAPPACGKNLDATLAVLDGPGGTLDPAFDAHILPIKFWALACWEGWFSTDVLGEVFELSALKFANAKVSAWARVCGPTTALIASLAR